jgi:hypothetical protein
MAAFEVARHDTDVRFWPILLKKSERNLQSELQPPKWIN